MRVFAATLTAAAMLGSAAFAQSDWETLYERGDWRLDVNMYDDGALSCESYTVGSSEIVFSVFSWQGGNYSFEFYKDEWKFPSEVTDEDFVIQIDRRPPWDISGSKQDQTIWVEVANTDRDALNFLTEVARGQNVYLKNTKGAIIGRFSLRGSSATLAQHRDCAASIYSETAGDSDPFN